MLKSVNLLNLASSLAAHSAQRHAVIADNIANADTPNFKAKDLQPFSEAFTAAQLQGDADMMIRKFDVMETNMGDAYSPNGNSVSLEDQMMRSAQTQNDHALALQLYKKSLTMMKTAIGKNI